MRQIITNGWLTLFLVLATSGCTSLPDVEPFAQSTSDLAAAAGTHYRDVARDVAALTAVRLDAESASAFRSRKMDLEVTKKVF